MPGMGKPEQAECRAKARERSREAMPLRRSCSRIQTMEPDGFDIWTVMDVYSASGESIGHVAPIAGLGASQHSVRLTTSC